MQITFFEITNTKYIQIYLTEEELEKQKTNELIDKYKKEKCSLAIFVTGEENYSEILKTIVTKQVELNKNVCQHDYIMQIRRELEEK